MNRIMIGAATLAGASTLALSLLAAPAFAAPLTPQVASASSKATETITSNVTVKDLYTTGAVAKFAGLTPGAKYDLVFAGTNSGGPVGDTLTASAKGTVTGKYVIDKPTKDTVKYSVGTLGNLALYTHYTKKNGTKEVVSKKLVVKYGSSLSWSPSSRSGGKVTFKVTAHKWSPATLKTALWSGVKVKFQKKVGSDWTTVKTVTTNDDGVAKTTITAPKHTWRAVVASTKTVWTSKTAAHKK